MLLELLHLPGQLEVLVDVPPVRSEDLVGKLKTGPEDLGDPIELGLPELGELDAGVFDLLDDGEEFFHVENKLLGACPAKG